MRWPCGVPVSNNCYVMLTVYFATKIFLLVMALETMFADMSSQINTRLMGIASMKFFATSSSTWPADGRTVGVTQAV